MTQRLMETITEIAFGVGVAMGARNLTMNTDSREIMNDIMDTAQKLEAKLSAMDDGDYDFITEADVAADEVIDRLLDEGAIVEPERMWELIKVISGRDVEFHGGPVGDCLEAYERETGEEWEGDNENTPGEGLPHSCYCGEWIIRPVED